MKFKHKSKSEYSLESDDEEEYSEINEQPDFRGTAQGGSNLPKGVTGGIRVMQIGNINIMYQSGYLYKE